jgi:hypothetical protein
MSLDYTESRVATPFTGHISTPRTNDTDSGKRYISYMEANHQLKTQMKKCVVSTLDGDCSTEFNGLVVVLA